MLIYHFDCFFLKEALNFGQKSKILPSSKLLELKFFSQIFLVLVCKKNAHIIGAKNEELDENS